jgi:putative colanic acid biosynthesis UDP-glucose lipid carrier transferase
MYLTAGVISVKSAVYFIIKYLRSRGVNNRNVMFFCGNNSTEVLKKIIEERKDFGYRIFDFPMVDFDLNSLQDFWKRNGIHTVFMPSEHQFKDKEEQIFRLAEDYKVHVSLVPDITNSDFLMFDLSYLETQPILNQTKYPLDYYSNFLFKRLFDLFFSVLVLLVICTWLFPIIAFFIKRSSPGPVFFRQKRYGYHDDVFSCLKFRTMVINEESASKTTSENDARITRVGRFLRKTSLDELPQFINVLKGEMSVVGPRPHMLAVDDYFKPKIGRYSLRSMVNPGITGLAQVSGLRGDSGDVEIEMGKRILADTFYVKNWSFVMDLVIVFKTVLLVLKGDKKAN